MEKPLATLTLEPNQPQQLADWLQGQRPDHCIVGATGHMTEALDACVRRVTRGQVVYLDHTTPIPIRNAYATPATLGPDRLAAAVAGWYAGGCRRPVLIIDSGTAITYDFVSADGTFLGGNISANAALRLWALHQQTARLPLLSLPSAADEEASSPLSHADNPDALLGHTTTEALRNGALLAIRYEAEGYMREFLLKYPNLLIIHTGGMQIAFEKKLKSRIFAAQNLVLEGLNLIMRHILQTKAQ